MRNSNEKDIGSRRPRGSGGRGGGGGAVLDEEIHWVLRNARMHAADPRLRSATGFAAGGGVAPAVHRSQIGRWETGKAEVNHGLVRRYEVVLGLPEGQLLCAIDYLSRDRAPVRSTATLHPKEPPELGYVQLLLERALSTHPMRGVHWDHLSSALGSLPDALIRERDWERLLRRCTQEMAVSVGLEFGLRDEAAARLAGHPRSGPLVAAAARATLQDPSAQIYSDAVGLLQYSDHPAAAAVLFEQLAHPTNSDALSAALFCLTTVIRSGRAGPEAQRKVAHLALSHLRERGHPFRVHRAAAHLLRALRLPGVARIATGLTAEDHRYAVSILLEERATAGEALRATQARVRSSLTEAFGSADGQEPVLRRLVTTATATTDDESRSNALAVLMLSPQGRVLGSTYAAELEAALQRGDHVAAHESLSVLTWVTQPEDLDLLVGLLLDPGTPAQIVMEAAIAAGNCREQRSAAAGAREQLVFTAAVAGVRAAPAARDDTASSEPLRQRLRGLVYFLGMRGRLDLVAALGSAVDAAGSHGQVCRGVVDWWLRLPPEVRALLEEDSAEL